MTRLAFPYGPAASGRSATVAYGSDAHVRQMLELLIFTMAGERVMRPDLGSPVKQMVFSAGNGPVAIALQATLQAAITQWLGSVLELHDLSVTFDDNEAVLEVAVTYENLTSKTAGKLAVRKELA
jgi:phage baseplate assembly protein W